MDYLAKCLLLVHWAFQVLANVFKASPHALHVSSDFQAAGRHRFLLLTGFLLQGSVAQASPLANTALPSPFPAQCLQLHHLSLVRQRPSGFCSCSFLSILELLEHPCMLCQRWLRSGSEQGQKLLSSSVAQEHSWGKKESLSTNLRAGKSLFKSVCRGERIGGAH